jgi:D-tyrosyl-tRNA(Tyr) deacylase
MKALVQRVSRASVSVDDDIVGEIGRGLVVFLGVAQGDSKEDASYLANKVVNLRIFADEASKFALSALETRGDILVVSQFTLLADSRKGRRPSFTDAAPPLLSCYNTPANELPRNSYRKGTSLNSPAHAGH